MNKTKNTLAIILGRRAYREYDSLLSVYSLDYGKLNLVVKGSQKLRSKLAGHLEPLNLVKIMIIETRSYDYIASALNQEVYQSIRQDLNKLYYAGRALKITKSLVGNRQPDKNIFVLLVNYLDLVNSTEAFTLEQGILFFSFFSLKLLEALGYCPLLYRCLNCQNDIKPGRNYLDLLNGGIICQNCFLDKCQDRNDRECNILAISDNCLKIMRFLLGNDLKQVRRISLNKKVISEVDKVIDSLLRFHLN